MEQRELFWALVHSRYHDFHKPSRTSAMVIPDVGNYPGRSNVAEAADPLQDLARVAKSVLIH
jgi:hypothetical protein